MSIEISELLGIDYAIGGVIVNAVSNLADSGPENYRSFLKRPVKERIVRLDYGEDSMTLLRKISNKTGGKKPQLPIIAYARKPGLSNGEMQGKINNRIMFNEKLLSAMKISVLPVSLEYTMTIASWDIPTLDKLQLAWYAFISKSFRKNSRFMFPALAIDDEVLEAPVNFQDSKTVLFTDVSPEKNESGRVFAVSTDFVIDTFILTGEGMTVPEKLTLKGAAVRYLRS